ncbi:MAG: HAD-IC family P-type ATPase, partial [Clostridiales bacterium]|nr:HAD-IC family P-type ATPase [Clostridiales bacterium]
RLPAAGTVVYVARDGRFIGSLVVADVIKEDAASAIKGLKDLGVRKTVMLTGDTRRVAAETAEGLGIDEVHSELLPHQKVSMVEVAQDERATNGKVVFVGDGINDAPALARADIGVAMGGLGSDAAIQAADVVIMTDQPGKLVKAISIARRTKAIVWQNIVFALGVKAAVLLLGALGLASMWEAVFADVGVALIAVLNSMRAIKT